MKRRATPMLTQNTFPDKSFLFSFAEYLAACGEDEGEENPP